jgi:raffinose/stachyose/melibiose transport system permease protein
MFTSPLFYKSVVNSLILAGASIFIQLPICMVLALILAKGVKGESVYRTLFFIPVIISSTVIAQLWAKIYHPDYGLLNTLLDRTGMESFKQLWLADPKYALGAVFVPMIWQYIGYHMLLFYSAAKSISPELREAAYVDGATEIQIALRIIIPMIIPMIKASVIFALIGSLKSFDLIYILTRGGPLHATSVPTMLMYNEIFTNNRYGQASAIAIFIVLECLVFTMFVQWIFRHIQRSD